MSEHWTTLKGCQSGRSGGMRQTLLSNKHDCERVRCEEACMGVDEWRESECGGQNGRPKVAWSAAQTWLLMMISSHRSTRRVRNDW